ncbi:MAG: polyphosphate polymerase domain-containing protein [Bacteroidota bacterium]|nr:polyphosphate polymerase domain-containing protein [Bacteroidota bacterium]
MENFREILNDFSPTTLDEMDNVKLMNRTDTKFVFNVEQLFSILEKAKDSYKLLKINNENYLGYETLYFDTINFDMYNAHINGKLNRYKIRQRKYLISDLNFLEIKFKNNKRRTIKKRLKIKSIETDISKKSKKFIENNSTFFPDSLEAKLESNFSRLTLVHKQKKERITIDINLNFKKENAKIELPFLVIAEVKQDGFSTQSDFMQILHQENVQPIGVSKYAIGTLLLNKNLKYNRYKNRLLTLKKISHDKFYSDVFA